ncbi:MAG: glycoside hydrolase/phage tail family protein [Rhizobiaceae bacterium]
MATILLQTAGAFLGGFLGPVGSAVGTAVGALAGYALDRALINGSRRIEGPRLSGFRLFGAEEGASLPRVYGTVRTGGTLIWATRFEEVSTTSRQGAKGGPRVTEHAYFGNAAFALCEGEIAGVRRVWADGREIDRTLVDLRVYQGGGSQPPDPLVAAKQGSGNTPAYRDTAYVVVDRLPLADYGNRLPQFEFEVIRAVAPVAKGVRAVSLIPGSTEYGLYPRVINRVVAPGTERAANRHVLHAETDLHASLDEMQATFPNLENVALVATWFGDDLRAGQCRIRPMVTDSGILGLVEPWFASGLMRIFASEVSRHGGNPAYGGSPADHSVVEAIAELKARGLGVTLCPFVMMDVPADNDLPDPYGGERQSAYPWRGRISCHPGPGQPGSADKTEAARTQIDAFCGAAESTDFPTMLGVPGFSGDPEDWGYRRFILHFAHLAVAAGGVDAFVIGSELRGLTTLRDADDAFPFVEQLCALATQVRAVLGPSTKITYAADWSEYFGHQPADGSGDVFFHLDPLWAHDDIDAVGIDNYMPIADWQDADYRDGNPDGFTFPYDPDRLLASIDAGEGFDWHYADAAARVARERAPITDGAYEKPWVFRYKDLGGWWANQHFDRPGGVQASTPTAWVARSKPIWFTELGSPAVDKGPNQPNVFADPKSSENAAPHFSSGGRSDLALLSTVRAHQRHWDPAMPGFDGGANPVSPIYGGRMVDPRRIYVWSWDARPFPAFPLSSDVWSDGSNWRRGHWLNGRAGAVSCAALLDAILADHGLPAADTRGVDGVVQGYVVSDPTTARAAMEPLADAFGIDAHDAAGTLVFRSPYVPAGQPVELDDLAVPDDGPVVERVRAPDHGLPSFATFAFRDPFRVYQAGTARAARPGADDTGEDVLSLPAVIEPAEADALVRDWLLRRWTERDELTFALPPAIVSAAPGATIRLPGDAAQYRVLAVDEGILRTVSARRLARVAPAAADGMLPEPPGEGPLAAGKPACHFLDLPLGPSGGLPQDQFRVAARADPWRPQRVWASPATSGFEPRALIGQRATTGFLSAALAPGREGRFQHGRSIEVALADGELSSAARDLLFNGANAAAILSTMGAWEIVQFEVAEEIAPSTWLLSSLLRGQMGTTDAMAAGADAGAPFVLLDHAVPPAGLAASEVGLALNWRVGPTGHSIAPNLFAEHAGPGGMRARLPLAPAHLKARQSVLGDLDVTWIRRGRIDADSWDAVEIPLGEAAESYRVEIAPVGEAAVRAEEVGASSWTYAAAAIASDFPDLPAEADITVRQISTAAGAGIAARLRTTID